MPQLTDLQRMLLTTAAARADGSLLPACDILDAPAQRVRKAADEQAVADEGASWRAAGDAWIGAVIADAGREAVAPSELAVAPAVTAAELEPQSAKRQTKTDAVLALLTGPDGASVGEIVAATSWQAHTTRAMLAGLRKKGHALVKSGERGSLRYRIEASAWSRRHWMRSWRG